MEGSADGGPDVRDFAQGVGCPRSRTGANLRSSMAGFDLFRGGGGCKRKALSRGTFTRLSLQVLYHMFSETRNLQGSCAIGRRQIEGMDGWDENWILVSMDAEHSGVRFGYRRR